MSAERTCKVNGCDRKVRAVGMCSRHYLAKWKRETQAAIPHGTASGYTRGCKAECPATPSCRDEFNREARERRQAQKELG